MTLQRQLTVWMLGLVVFGALLYVLRGMLGPFVAGAIIAYFLDPLADRLEKRGLSRTTATIVLTGGFFVFLAALLMVLLPLLHGQIVGFASRLPGYIDGLRDWAAPLIEQFQNALSEEQAAQLAAFTKNAASTVVSWLGQVLSGMWSGGLAVFDLLSILLITPLVCFYMIRDWDVMVGKVDGWLPRDFAATIRDQINEVDATLSGFIRGQATVCLILAAYYGIALSIAQLDFGLVVGISAGLISFIPYFGAIVGVGAALIIVFIQFGDLAHLGIVAAIFVVGQIAESNFMTPKLVGERIGLHAVWVVFALMVGGSLFGFVGVVLAVPVAAVIGVLVRFGLKRYLASPLYHGDAEVSAAPLISETQEDSTA